MEHVVLISENNEALWFGNCGDCAKIKDTPYIIMASTGMTYSVVIDVDGNVWFSGEINVKRRLSPSFLMESNGFTKFENVSNVVSVASGSHHCFLLDDAGSVFSFGFFWGFGQSTPTKIPGIPPIKNLFCFEDRAILIDFDGNCFLLGENCDNLERICFTDEGEKLPPIRLASIGRIHNILISYDGVAYVFGENNFGELGLSDGKRPFEIKGLPKIRYVKCLGTSSLLIDIHNQVWGFGYNEFEQFDLELMLEPTKLSFGIENICDIVWSHKFILFINQQAECFVCKLKSTKWLNHSAPVNIYANPIKLNCPIYGTMLKDRFKNTKNANY